MNKEIPSTICKKIKLNLRELFILSLTPPFCTEVCAPKCKLHVVDLERAVMDMYMCVRGNDFASSYFKDFSIGYWNCSDSVVVFCEFLFISYWR